MIICDVQSKRKGSNLHIGTSDKDMSNNVEIFGGEDPVFGAVESGTASAELELTFNNVICKIKRRKMV